MNILTVMYKLSSRGCQNVFSFVQAIVIKTLSDIFKNMKKMNIPLKLCYVSM